MGPVTPPPSNQNPRSTPLDSGGGPFNRKPLPPPGGSHVYNTSNSGKKKHQRRAYVSVDDTANNSSNNNNDHPPHPHHFVLPHRASSSFDGKEDFDYESERPHHLPRHLTLLDLLAVGIGGTIGSGLFVLAGLVSHKYAGPAAVWSWAVSGLAALLSGCCYAELSGRIPLPGSAYAYTFVALGEWPAFLAAVCLSIEYIVASAAVARSWGDKCALWLVQQFEAEDDQAAGDDVEEHWILTFLKGTDTFSPLSCLMSTSCILLLLAGVKESKRVTNFFTLLKVSVVAFMIIAGSFYVRPSNWAPFSPMGVAGIFRGASGTFFGYLGYDQVCGMAGEAINPKRNMPAAILLTLLGVAFIYMTATFVLTGMQPWPDISTVAGFPSAFFSNHAALAGQLTALGELATLPIVVLITNMVQPRLQYAMAVDGLLPPFFARINATGNLWHGTAVSGTLMILCSTLVPFEHLNDTITCAVLTALSLTDSSLIVLWHEAPDPESNLPHWLMLAFNCLAFLSSILWNGYAGDSWQAWWAAFFVTALTCTIPGLIQWTCPRTAAFGGRRKHYHDEELHRDVGYFETPFDTLLPSAAIFVNWFLIAQLDWTGVLSLLAFLGLMSLYYFFYASHYSVGNTTGWGDSHLHHHHTQQESAAGDGETPDESSRLLAQSNISMSAVKPTTTGAEDRR